MSAPYTVLALEPVWVPGASSKVGARKGRAPSPGPDGESAESGRWRLALPDGTVYEGPTLSASAIDTASACERKWALDRLDGHTRQTNEAAERGTAAHSELEAWQRYGARPTIPGMAAVLAEFPVPGASESECQFGLLFGRPGHEVVFSGFIDARESAVRIRRKVSEGETYNPLEGPLSSTIRDLKTTGDWRWKKTAAQLRSDLQAAMYALGEMARVDAARVDAAGYPCAGVVLKWTYAQLKLEKDGSFKVVRVETVGEDGSGASGASGAAEPGGAGVWMARDQAVAVVAQYLPLAERMFELIASGATSAQTEKNAEACSMYGGCGWKKTDPVTCVPPAGGGFMSLMRQERDRLGVVVDEKQQQQQEQLMSLGTRFGKQVNEALNGAVPGAVPGAVLAASGLNARFSKVSTTVTLAASAQVEPTKLAAKASTDGMSSRAAEPTTPQAGSLRERLATLNIGKVLAPAVLAAVTAADNAPALAVLAVGINPPDAAPEWRVEQQEAESARLSGPSAATPTSPAEPVKRGRGRPAGSVKVASAPAPAPTSFAQGVAGGDTVRYTVEQATADVDAIAARLLAAGFRREALTLLQAAESF